MISFDAFSDKPPRFFNHNIDSLQIELQNYVKMMGKRLKRRHNIEKYTYDLLEPGADQIFVYGRIYAGFQEDDPNERLTEKNAEIHFHPKFNIPYLKLDYPKDKVPGLFRGQIVAARGTVDSQSFHAAEILTDCRESLPATLSDDFSARILAVAGPYVTDTLEQCEELNAKIKSYNPDCVIFFGPFAPSTSKLLTASDCKYTARELTEAVIEKLTSDISHISIVIPETTDSLALPVIPRPALSITSDASLKADPSFITINNELEIMATANDLQLLIGRQFAGSGVKRDEIPKQIVHQCSACPLIEPTIQIQYLMSLLPKVTPHIIIMPSRFYFYQNSFDGTHVIYVRPENKSGPLSFVVVDVKGSEISAKTTNEFYQ